MLGETSKFTAHFKVLFKVNNKNVLENNQGKQITGLLIF